MAALRRLPCHAPCGANTLSMTPPKRPRTFSDALPFSADLTPPWLLHTCNTTLQFREGSRQRKDVVGFLDTQGLSARYASIWEGSMLTMYYDMLHLKMTTL